MRKKSNIVNITIFCLCFLYRKKDSPLPWE